MTDIEKLCERLSDMGFEVEENEEEALGNALRRAEQTVVNYCNTESVPEELEFAVLDMAAGEYLLAAHCQDAKEGNVRSLSEGDMSVSFGDENIGSVIDGLFLRGREEMTAFRRIKW